MNENNNETTFENAKVGDKVYDIRYGEGEIISIKESSEHPVGVGFPNIPYKIIYKFNGLEYRDHKNRILFWDKPQIIAPPRPKRMVKKWQWIYGTINWENNGNLGISDNFYTSEEEFKKRCPHLRPIEPYLKSEIEVEE